MTWDVCDRERVRGWIEDATGAALGHSDPLPDTLLTAAQALGLEPIQLRIWVYDMPKPDAWTVDALANWARRLGFARDGVMVLGEGGNA